MSRVYAIEVRDTPFYRECGVDRFRVLRQEGVADRYEIRIYLDGRDLYYVSSATYWLPPPHQVAGIVERPEHTWEGLAAAGPASSVPRTVNRSWRNPDCSLTIWTNKVFTFAVQVALKNGQVIRARHRLTSNEDFRAHTLRPADTMYHGNATVSFGVEPPSPVVEADARAANMHTDQPPRTMEAGR